MSEKEQLPKVSTEPKEPMNHHKREKLPLLLQSLYVFSLF